MNKKSIKEFLNNFSTMLSSENIYSNLTPLHDNLANNSRITIIEAIVSNKNTTSFHIAKKPLLSANMSRIAEHIYSGVPVMFISAERSENSSKKNELLRKKLVIDIINKDLSFVKIAGSWSDKKQNETGYEPASREISFMVLGYNRHGNKIVDYDTFKTYALDWCVKYNQMAVIVGKAIEHTTDGSVNFEMYTRDSNSSTVELADTFAQVHFSSPVNIKKVHDKYVAYKNISDEDNYGFGYSQKSKKSDSAFVLNNKDKAEFIDNLIKNKTIESNYNIYYNKTEKWYRNLVSMYRLDD